MKMRHPHVVPLSTQAIERQLAHVEKNRVRRAYNKAELLPERQKMMQDWGNYLQDMST